MTGKSVTPYILKRIHEITQGESVDSNIALIEENARVAAKLAIELASKASQTISSAHFQASSQAPPEIVVIGGAVHDLIGQPGQGKMFVHVHF